LQTSNGAQKKDKKLKTGRKDLFNAEIEINNLPPRVRNLLTKGYIQEQIQWKSSNVYSKLKIWLFKKFTNMCY